MSNNKLGIGLIGVGGISFAHEMGYKEKGDRARIVAVCDVDRARAEQRAAPHAATVYTDYHALLADPQVDLVDITVPHTLHFPVAKAALEAKKHVAMEKPLTVHAPEGLALIQLAQQQGVHFTVTENTRFVEAYVRVEQLIRSGELGEPRMIRTFISGSEVYRLRRTDNWKGRSDGTGGGALLDGGAHSIYLIKWLAGEVDQVWGYQYQWVPESQVEDNGLIGGRLKSGGLFSSEISFTVEAPWNERLEYHGSKGSVIVDQLTNPPAVHYRGGQDYDPVSLGVTFQPRLWKLRSITDGVKDYVDAVYDDRPPSVDPMDAYYAILVIDRAYQAIAGYAPLTVEER